jgi:AraC-like DNA-binding protein
VHPSGRRLEFDADSVIIYPPGAVHDQHCRSAGEDECVLVAPARSSGTQLRDACHLPAVTDLYLVRELVSLTKTGTYAHQARRYVSRHYRDIRSVPDVARALGLSPDHLRHLYRQTYQTTLQADLNRARLENAANLWPSASTSAAHRAGFAKT